MNRKGFAPIVILLIVLVVALLACGVWYYSSRMSGSSISSNTGLIHATTGGTVTLADGSSITIPPGMLKQDETVTLSLAHRLPDTIPNGAIKQVGNGLELVFSDPAEFNGTHTRATATSGIQFVINMGTNKSGLDGSLGNSWTINASGQSTLIGAFGSYDKTANQATVYVGADVLGVSSPVKQVDVGMTNF